jgi:hypothetical protein
MPNEVSANTPTMNLSFLLHCTRLIKAFPFPMTGHAETMATAGLATQMTFINLHRFAAGADHRRDGG